jgi:hypothetical protein
MSKHQTTGCRQVVAKLIKLVMNQTCIESGKYIKNTFKAFVALLSASVASVARQSASSCTTKNNSPI